MHFDFRLLTTFQIFIIEYTPKTNYLIPSHKNAKTHQLQYVDIQYYTYIGIPIAIRMETWCLFFSIDFSEQAHNWNAKRGIKSSAGTYLRS